MGRLTCWIAAALVVFFGVGPGAGDSQAVAGILKNSVRVGDRSGMNLVEVPGEGEKRLTRRPPVPADSGAATQAGASAGISAGMPAGASGRLARRGLDHGWFWHEHRADAPASARRWEQALASLEARRAGGRAMFDAGRIGAIARRYEAQIAKAARTHGVSELLLLAVIAVESAGQQGAVSPKGARGLMQLIPATARRFGVGDSFDPAQNIDGGAAYLDWLLENFRDDPILALAGYNAGEGAVIKHKGVPPYAETRDYVVKVFDALAAARALCKALPDSPRRPCGWPAGPAS